MNLSRPTLWISTLALMLTGLVLADATAFAQRDAGAKFRGEFGTDFWSSTRSAGRYLQSANDGCQDLYQYTNTTPAIVPSVAKKASEDISKNVDAAKKYLGAVRKEAAGDKAVVAKLDAIEKHLAAAMDHHKKMHEECCKDHVDAEKTADCCSDMITELEKAQAEHRALMRLLNPPKPVAAEKTKK